MCKPIMKAGVCIAENLGKCKGGCEAQFIKDMRRAGFKGIVFRSTGKKERL